MDVYGLFESPRELIEKFVCEHDLPFQIDREPCRFPVLTVNLLAGF